MERDGDRGTKTGKDGRLGGRVESRNLRITEGKPLPWLLQALPRSGLIVSTEASDAKRL